MDPNTKTDVREQLAEVDENILTADGFDDALIGYTDSWGPAEGGGMSRVFRAVYSVRRCVEVLVAGGMAEDEALEYLEFNAIGAYVGPHTPVYVHDMEHL